MLTGRDKSLHFASPRIPEAGAAPVEARVVERRSNARREQEHERYGREPLSLLYEVAKAKEGRQDDRNSGQGVRRTWAPKSRAPVLTSFGRHAFRQLRGRVIVVWDGGSNHNGPLIRELLRRYPRLHLERLPAYAPDLNPVEVIWSNLKHGLPPNFVPRHVKYLDEVVHASCHPP